LHKTAIKTKMSQIRAIKGLEMGVINLVFFSCNRCTSDLTFAKAEYATKQGWMVDEKDGTCLCPICVWETTGKLPPTRKAGEEYLESIRRLNLSAESYRLKEKKKRTNRNSGQRTR